MILYGSRALLLQRPGIINRTPSDFDFCCTMEEYEDWFKKNKHKINITENYQKGNKMIIEGDTNCEFEIIEPGKSSELLNELVKEDKETIHTKMGMIPSLDMLFTLKTSHRYQKNCPHFWKTLFDYHKMKANGAKVRKEFEFFLKMRESEQYKFHLPKLNVNKDKFFNEEDNGVHMIVDHDSLHVALALHDRPAYTYYLKDGSEVMCDKNKFFTCDRSIQIAGILEEAAVLFFERSFIPFPGVMTISQGWHFAFSKVCTSITSGWFRKFGYENAPEILSYYPYLKLKERFDRGMENGTIIPFKGKNY